MKLRHMQAVWLMVLVTLMWAMAGVVTRHLTEARSFEVTFWRSFFAMLSLLVILPLWQGRQSLRTLPWRSRLFWLSALCWCVMFTAYMVAMTLTTVANVLVTLSIGPLLTALFSRLFIGHRLALRTQLAIVVAGSGIAYMQSANVQLDQAGNLSSWAGFLVALCVPVAGSTQWTLMHHQQQGPASLALKSSDMLSCVLVGAALSALLTLPLAWPMQADAHDLALLGFLGLFQLAIPCVLSVVCATVLKAPEIAMLALLEVIFGILLAWVGAGEAPGGRVLVGGALVIGALLANEVMAWRQKNARSRR